MIHVLVPVADGTEESEAVILIDTFRRAGWSVDCLSLDDREITASRGVRLRADGLWPPADDAAYDALVLPGGAGGTARFLAEPSLLALVRDLHAANRLVGAICAAPQALQAAGILRGRRATCHPAVRGALTEAVLLDDRVVVDGRVVTSRGPGTAFEMALTVIRILENDDTARRVAEGLVLFPGQGGSVLG
jgi:4-methyl-5(b-hydroxyethyl)-thiazole monophosphate biosynthesis